MLPKNGSILYIDDPSRSHKTEIVRDLDRKTKPQGIELSKVTYLLV